MATRQLPVFGVFDTDTGALIGFAAGSGGEIPMGLSATISGTPGVGNTLTAKLPTGTTGSLQWVRVASDGTTTDIVGATSSTYVQQPFDAGYSIRVRVTGAAFLSQGGVSVPASAQTPVFGAVASIVGFGDSITYGGNATSQANRWIERVGAALGATVLNQGISGTVLQNSAGASGVMANNGRDRFVSALLGSNKKAMVFLAYGFNDARYTGAPGTFNVTQYGNDYREVLAGLIDGGYPPDKICIVSPYYITNTGLITGSTGFQNQTRTNFEAFVTTSRNIAVEFGTWWYDSYNGLLNKGGASNIDTDNIHLTDGGHKNEADGILYESIRPSTRLNQTPTLSVTAASAALNWTVGTVSGATSYTTEYMNSLDGTWTFTGTTTGNSGSFTGLAAGTYNVRTRANFSDSTSSPWVFSGRTVVSVAQTGVVFNATFTGTAGTTLTTYTPETGSPMVVATSYNPSPENVLDGTGGAYAQTTNQGVYRTQESVSAMPYTVEFDLKKYSTISTDNNGVIFHAQPSINTHYFVRYNVPNTSWQLYKNTNGSPVQLGSSVSQTFTDGTTKVCKVDVTDLGGGQIQIVLTVDGTAIITYTDTSPLTFSGYAGIRDATIKTATTGIHMERLRLLTA